MTNIENKNLEEFSEQFRLIISNMNCVAYRIDCTTSSPVYFEGNLKSITGYKTDEFITGKIEWKDIILPEDFSLVKNESEKILSIENYVADTEYKIFHKSGKVIWVRDIAKKFFDKNTNTTSICGTLFDITKSKTNEEELRESEERYKSFFEDNSSITLIINPDTQQILDANIAACNYYGWSHAQLTSMKINEINTLSPEEIKREIAYARKKKRKYFLFKHRLSNGNIRDVEVYSGPIKLKGKQVLYSVIRDITESKLMEESLLQTQFAIERARDTIFWIGADAKILYVNDSACKALEYTKEELLNLKIFDIDPHFQKDIWLEHWEKSRHLKSYIIETHHKTKSGELIPIEISINFIVFGGKEYHAAFGRDISQRKKAEDALHKYKHILDESQRIAHIGSWELDINSNKLTWSDETYRIYGLEKDKGRFQLTFKNLVNSIYEDDKEPTLKQFNSIIITKVFEPFNFRIRRSNGTISWIYITGNVYSDINGNPKEMIGTIQDVTEQRKYENDLRISEAKFSQAFKISPDSININRLRDGLYIEINEGFTRLTGYTKEDVVGKSTIELSIWVDPNDRNQLVKELNEKGEVINLEARFRLKNGDIKTGLMSASIIEVDGEKCILSITRDISRRKGAEDALKESEERFHLMFQNNGAVMLIIEPDTYKIIDANTAAIDFYGYSHETICSMTLNDINVLPGNELSSWRNSTAAGERNHFILNHRLANGQIKTVEAYSSTLTVHEKTYIFGIIHDITERIKAENELKQRSAALEAAANAVVITDSRGIINWANFAFYKLTGYHIDEVIGKSSNILKSGIQPDEYYKNLWETITAGNIWRGEIINKRKDNSLYTEEMTITPLKDDIGNISHYIAIKQDVTERKNSEIELLKAKEKAEISEELKSAFLAQMSHEIRSPLYRILGYISLIKETFEDSDIKNVREIIEYFSSIDLSSRRLTKTIDSILNMSELQTQSYQPRLSKVNISALMEQLRKEHLQQAGLKMINLYITPVTKNSTIICDEYSVTQIFANLIDNALKYTAKGEVQIIINRNKKKQLFVEVRDTGIGISQEFINQLFNPFTQEETGYSRKFEGNGLGLALVKSYCDINHADVEVESEKGKGTTFRVTFK